MVGDLDENSAAVSSYTRARDEARDQSAEERDRSAHSRDVAADLRDWQAARQDEAVMLTEGAGGPAIRALLSAGAIARGHAAADRASAADDRRLAAEDRVSASADRDRARVELGAAHSDSLTGAQRLDLGRITLQNEIERSRRSDQPFALAFIDVDGLKQLNDRDGHAAGDVLLQAVVTALKTGRRSYDPIVRVGGDEFLCGFTNTDLAASRRRIEEIRGSLERAHAAASISVGLAILGERDTLEKLIARADADMYSHKHVGVDRRRGNGGEPLLRPFD
jgi:diguanylate cyclase (GGDEF)-like protein